VRDAFQPLVLIVDDNAEHLSFLRDAIASRFRVALAASGIDACALARRLQPDVILLDVSMPIVDGQTVIRRLRASDSTRAIPIVLVTGLETEAVQALPERVHVSAVLRKPCHLGEILDAINVAVSGALPSHR
jgi:CheY-like chemotaxis protein